MQRGGGKCCWTQVKCLGAGVGMCTEDRGEEERKAEGLDGWWEEVCATLELRGEENLPHVCHLSQAVEPQTL